MTLAEARRAAGLSQAKLARQVGISIVHLSGIERGVVRRPSHQVVTRIMRTLHGMGLRGVQTLDLFPVDDQPTEPAA